ncbi:MAG: hypothetical protein ACI8RZ_003725 [Myxococcota bacterium]|jgi:hypothetical protein
MHWSFPLGVATAFLLTLTSDFVIGYLMVIAAHQAGHYLIARRGGLETVGIDLNAVGGSMQHLGEGSRLRHTLAGAGGVLGQAVLLLLVMVIAAAFNLNTEGPLYEAMTTINLIIMMLNLLPLSGTDAESIWSLPSAVVGRIEEKLTYMQIQEGEEQRADWQQLIDQDSAAAQVPRPGAPTPAVDLAALLAEQDAQADAGITDDLAAEVSSLLAGVWGSGEE